MSVVLLKNDGKHIKIAADSMCCNQSSGVKWEKDKLFEFKGVYIGHVGYMNICDAINEKVEKVPEQIFPSIISLKNFFNEFSSILTDDNNHQCIVIISKKVFYVKILKTGVCVSDISNVPYYGIGWFEMAYGAMLTGMNPSDAIKLCAPHNLFYNDNVKEFDIEL